MAAAGKENTTCAWTLLAMLPKFVLHAPYRGGRKGHTSYANHVLKCLERWQAREYASLWYDAISSFNNKQHSSPKTSHNDEKRAAIRTEPLARQGEFSRGMAALTASPMAPESPETLSKLRNKHPCRLPCPAFLTEFLATEPPPTKCPPLQLTEQETSAAVKSFHRGSSGGTMGLCPEHITGGILRERRLECQPTHGPRKVSQPSLGGESSARIPKPFRRRPPLRLAERRARRPPDCCR